jgi:hypothetical protein
LFSALPAPVAGAPGGVQADGGGGDPVVEPPPPVEVLGQHDGKAHGDLVPASIGGHGNRGHQTGSFRVQPLQGTVPAGELLRHGHVRQRPQMTVSSAGRVQVVAEQPVAGLLPSVGLRAGVGEPLGVQAQQVMHPPPAARTGSGLGQVRPGQARQHRAHLAGRQASQGRGGCGGYIRAGIDRQQPEHPRGGFIEPPAGQLERRGDRRRGRPAAVVIGQPF